MYILGMKTNIVSLESIEHSVCAWINQNESRYICVANVHMCIEAYDKPSYQMLVNDADLVIPDGKPLFWLQRLHGYKNAHQTRGMDVFLMCCALAQAQGFSVGFYGSTKATLAKLTKATKSLFPHLNIVLSHSPPFRKLTEQESLLEIEKINQCHPDILFVGLGCPKQEKWMAQQKGKVTSVMIGIGAVFDFVAGTKKHAPLYMQKLGLEWFYRLLQEPRRLAKRYFYTNFKFIILVIFYQVRVLLRKN